MPKKNANRRYSIKKQGEKYNIRLKEDDTLIACAFDTISGEYRVMLMEASCLHDLIGPFNRDELLSYIDAYITARREFKSFVSKNRKPSRG